MKYYVSHIGLQLGPLSEDEIIKKIQSVELAWTDFLFDEVSKEWVMLMEHENFSSVFKSWVSPQKNHVVDSIADGKEWFILKAENKYGPFSFLELVRMLQEKNIYEYDFVWNAKLSDWKKINEIEDFKIDNIRALKKSLNEEIKEAFFRRRYVRKSYGTTLLIHNSKAVWKGQTFEISPGGAGIVVEEAQFEPGQTLFLHFKVGEGVPPFNAICSVVSKKIENSSNEVVLMKYGMKFTSISQSIQQAIKSFTDKAA